MKFEYLNKMDFLKTKFSKFEVARVWAHELQQLLFTNESQKVKISKLEERVKELEEQLAQSPFVRLYA